MSAPSKDDTPMSSCGVNQDTYTSGHMTFISTPAAPPTVWLPWPRVLHDNFGIADGLMTTVHSTTATQKTVDGVSVKGLAWQPCRLRQYHPSSTNGAARSGQGHSQP